ncbi:MAG: GtrA family protein [Sphingobacteriaceae bacterium]
MDFIKPGLFFKFLKFIVVGFSGVIVDFSFTYLSKEKLKFNKYFANSIGFAIATSNNFFLNHYWTFEKMVPAKIIEFGNFFLIALFGLGLNNLIIYFLNDHRKINFYQAKLVAIIIVSIWNFFANYLYTFA